MSALCASRFTITFHFPESELNRVSMWWRSDMRITTTKSKPNSEVIPRIRMTLKSIQRVWVRGVGRWKEMRENFIMKTKLWWLLSYWYVYIVMSLDYTFPFTPPLFLSLFCFFRIFLLTHTHTHTLALTLPFFFHSITYSDYHAKKLSYAWFVQKKVFQKSGQWWM